MMIETAVVLAVPALIVVGLGILFDLSGVHMLVGLAIAFVLSWIIIIFRLRTFNKSWQQKQ